MDIVKKQTTESILWKIQREKISLLTLGIEANAYKTILKHEYNINTENETIEQHIDNTLKLAEEIHKLLGI